MIGFKGGVISELNNCGPTYTDNGKYLLGQRNLTAKLTTSTSDVATFVEVSGGVATLMTNGDLYFSPDGRYLDGGGNTVKLLTINYKYEKPFGGMRGSPSVDTYLNTSLGVLGNSLIIAQTRDGAAYGAGRVVSTKRVCGFRSGTCTNQNIYELGYRSDITSVDLPSRSAESFSYGSPVRRFDRVLGGSNGFMYVQFSNGDIGRFDSIAALKGVDSATILHSAAPRIEKVIPYRHGLAAYNKTTVYWSNNASQVVAGSDVRVLYSGVRNITSLLNYGGAAANESSLRVNATAGLVTAFDDGYIFFSPDGNNLSGGGSSYELVRAFDTEQMKLKLKNYLDSLSSASYLTSDFGGGNVFQYINPVNGSKINIKNLTVKLLNRGDSADYAKNIIFFNGTGTSQVTSLVSGFDGDATTVTVYDKGWDGIEYKWRDRGSRTGLFAYTTDGSYIGAPEIKIKASNGCVLAATYEEIGGSGEAFSVGNWNLNADFTVANNSAGNYAIANFFAPGGASIEFPTPYQLQPKNFTVMELYSWAIYNVGVYIKDKYSVDLIHPGPAVIYMRTDADRQRLPH